MTWDEIPMPAWNKLAANLYLYSICFALSTPTDCEFTYNYVRARPLLFFFCLGGQSPECFHTDRDACSCLCIHVHEFSAVWQCCTWCAIKTVRESWPRFSAEVDIWALLMRSGHEPVVGKEGAILVAIKCTPACFCDHQAHGAWGDLEKPTDLLNLIRLDQEVSHSKITWHCMPWTLLVHDGMPQGSSSSFFSCPLSFLCQDFKNIWLGHSLMLVEQHCSYWTLSTGALHFLQTISHLCELYEAHMK